MCSWKEDEENGNIEEGKEKCKGEERSMENETSEIDKCVTESNKIYEVKISCTWTWKFIGPCFI